MPYQTTRNSRRIIMNSPRLAGLEIAIPEKTNCIYSQLSSSLETEDRIYRPDSGIHRLDKRGETIYIIHLWSDC